MRTYRAFDTDSSRWDHFAFRDGDIVISSPMKAGTTWTQMICALLVFGTPDLPQPLGALSPWLDMLIRPIDEVVAQLDAQDHRRFIKTHTPLDGVPADGRVTYIGVGRHPLDLAVSAAHHSANIDVEFVLTRISEVIGPDEAMARLEGRPVPSPDPVERLRFFVEEDVPFDHGLTLRGVLDHYATYFAGDRRVVALHYADLQRDLDGEMRRLAAELGIAVDEDRWPALVAAAGFESMKADADRLVPDAGPFKDADRFFRAGGSGEWVDLLGPVGEAAYHERVAALGATPDLVAWAHHGRSGT